MFNGINYSRIFSEDGNMLIKVKLVDLERSCR